MNIAKNRSLALRGKCVCQVLEKYNERAPIQNGMEIMMAGVPVPVSGIGGSGRRSRKGV